MENIQQFFSIILIIQIIHSIEELTTGFHKKWYLTKIPFWVFLLFELCFSGFWIYVLFTETFPNRAYFQASFLILMFANGIQHIIWAGVVKKYVPGLLTAILHIVVFLMFYFQAITQLI